MRCLLLALFSIIVLCGNGAQVMSAEATREPYESKSTAMKFALFPRGTFKMGSHESSSQLVAKYRECGAKATFFAQECRY
ncbi:MAG: hypothetical protein JWP89_1012 [Schlesneria sp.]|nr:hypothetical protein [Schlesneria sp.]